MELRQLSYFIAVVEQGTITGAARALHMSQPPLTAQMHALESELGCALFEHVGRRLRITEAGRALYAHAKSITALCQSAVDEMADLSAGAGGVLRLGIISSVCGEEFIGWLGEFHRTHPDVRFDLSEANTYQLLSELRARALDMAIVRTPFAAPDMTALPLRREPMLAVGRAEFFEAAAVNTDSRRSAPGSPRDAALDTAATGGMRAGDETTLPDADDVLGLDALRDSPVLVYRRWEGILRDRFERLGIAPRIVCVNDNAQTTLALAHEGLGIALVPASTLAGRAADGLIRRTLDEPDTVSDITAIYRNDAELPALARLFLQALPI